MEDFFNLIIFKIFKNNPLISKSWENGFPISSIDFPATFGVTLRNCGFKGQHERKDKWKEDESAEKHLSDAQCDNATPLLHSPPLKGVEQFWTISKTLKHWPTIRTAKQDSKYHVSPTCVTAPFHVVYNFKQFIFLLLVVVGRAIADIGKHEGAEEYGRENSENSIQEIVPHSPTHWQTQVAEKQRELGSKYWQICTFSALLSLCALFHSLCALFTAWRAMLAVCRAETVIKADKSVARSPRRTVIPRRLHFAAQKRLQLDGKDVCFATVELDRSVGGKSSNSTIKLKLWTIPGEIATR